MFLNLQLLLAIDIFIHVHYMMTICNTTGKKKDNKLSWAMLYIYSAEKSKEDILNLTDFEVAITVKQL